MIALASPKDGGPAQFAGHSLRAGFLTSGITRRPGCSSERIGPAPG
jgi:hypothetical protein